MGGLESRFYIGGVAVARFETLVLQCGMGDDVESPLLEVRDLALRLADDNLDERLVEPGRLSIELFGGGNERSARAFVRSGGCFLLLRLASCVNLPCPRLPTGDDSLV